MPHIPSRTSLKKYAPGVAIAVPLMAYAFFGGTEGSFFAKIASAGYGADKITVCRPTGSDIKPYVKVSVPEHVAARFLERGGVLPGPDGECPDSSDEDVKQNIEERIANRYTSILSRVVNSLFN